MVLLAQTTQFFFRAYTTVTCTTTAVMLHNAHASELTVIEDVWCCTKCLLSTDVGLTGTIAGGLVLV